MPTKILLLLLIICFLEGCSSERRKYISDREIKEIIINPEKTEDYLDISEVLSDSIDIIPLEVTENCLISDIKKLEFYKNRNKNRDNRITLVSPNNPSNQHF